MPVGFILHPTYYLEKGGPVVHLFGRLETGETFVVMDDRLRPHFFLRTHELAAARRVASFAATESHLTTTSGEPVSRVFTAIPQDVPGLRDRLQVHGIPTFEADLPFVTKFLMDREIRGAVRIEGESRPGRLIGRIFRNPQLSPGEWVPEPSLLSLDIETDPQIQRVLSIALWGPAGGEVLVVRPEGGSGRDPEVTVRLDPTGTSGGPGPEAAVRVCADEPALLTLFQERLRALDPDVLTGWNVIDFDLRVLRDRCDAHHLPFQLGRADIPCRLLLDRTAWGASRAVVPGRVVLDGLALLRSAFIRLEDYRLETAAREILGRGKTLTSEDRGEEILRLYEGDLPAFLRYNLEDARLVLEIVQTRHLLDLAVRQSLITGMPLDRTGASIASFDFLYLTELHRRGQVAPTVDAARPVAPTQGGFVLSSRPGIYDQVAVLDYRSLYPSLIRTFRLDPLSLIENGEGSAGPDSPPPITAPNGARFRREGGILPEILDRLFPLREAALARGDLLTSTALKILMNSFYGVLATPRCRLYSPPTANAITGFGQQTLLWTREEIEARGHRVLYGDTDSIFVETGAATAEEASRVGQRLAEELDAALAARFRMEHGVESRTNLRFDRLFRRLLLPALRGSGEGSKKRYAGLTGEGEDERMVFVGLEVVRRDWTDLSKSFQRELLSRVFHGKPVDEFIREFLARLRAGEMDDLLVYRKALRKPEESYTRTTPPHVQAARLLSGPPGRIVRYVMTTAGPEPERERQHPLDREHYVEKQVRPIAESVLSLLNLSWEGIAGGQGRLPF